ncbi:MAG: hypothetical protein KatS3mg102_2219 [Planctomycetota bacterium]|nr:MAG: hypothetical protein KatS3mg102_2219 [Planctomycetota bacterium]
MSMPPPSPKIYHITHVDNLAAIVADGALLSDAAMVRRGGPPRGIGLSGIKRRRIKEIEVRCHPGTRVGDYVPFYFCPRSIMLFVIHCANHPELTYRDGQDPIVHLEADLHQVIQWADGAGVRWAFSLSNAGAYHVEFRTGVHRLGELNWPAIAATDFRDRDVKEGKQAEFLVHGRFPWHLVRRIGVRTDATAERPRAAAAGAAHTPLVEVKRNWYF